MEPLRAVIIEDEPNGRELLYSMCEELGSDLVKVVGIASNADQGLQSIESNRPDLIFLDIKMPEKSGFEMLASLQKIDFDIIFTTAHSEFAIKAFEYSAISYLLKPIDEEKLIEALHKAQKSKENKEMFQRIRLLEQKLNNNKSDKICINIGGRYEIIYLEKLMYLKADGNYSILKYDGKEIITARTLKKFESILPEEIFFRISRSTLVNVNNIKSFVTKGEDKFVLLSNKEELPVSPSKFKKLISKI